MDALTRPVLLLTRAEIARLMTPADYLAAVEAGFRASGEGVAIAPAPMHLEAGSGGFHVKAAGFTGARAYAAFKVNGNFPDNPRRGLPTIQGVIVLCDAADGALLALMDSIEITLRRTAGATALAARHLARPDAATATICGCGAQAPAQLDALADVLPLKTAFAFDADPERALAFARRSGPRGVEIVAVTDMAEAALASDVVVTCTTSRRPFLRPEHVRAGTFIAAVGADNPDKSEIDPALMATATVVADVLEQAAAMGDLRHALAAGALSLADVRGDLAGLVTGTIRGRTDEAEITLFDSTGSALQDAASAARVYERAVTEAAGVPFALGDA